MEKGRENENEAERDKEKQKREERDKKLPFQRKWQKERGRE